MTKVDIRALAKLSRLEISDDEVLKLEQEIPEILKFVEAIQKAGTTNESAVPELRNVMRVDSDPHEGGKYSKALLSAAPASKENRVVVKQVISRKSASGGK